ncbi:MAG: DUF2000 family protein [Mycobacteriales bacterium]
MSENDMKFVVVLNRSYELSRLTSGLGHATAGLVASLAQDVDKLSFVEYTSSDGQPYPWISDYPFITLKGRGGQMQTFRENLIFRGLPCVTYLDTMLAGGSVAQQEATSQRSSAELTPLVVATFGPSADLNEMTKKFSVWQ